jgi:hypothetical protein
MLGLGIPMTVRRHEIRNPAERLRSTVERLPGRTKEAMLRGIATNRIVVGAYVDPDSGGICPMLAAHRNGGRTSVASFARAWDAYTGAKRPRRATRREVHYLRALLEESLAAEGLGEGLSLTEAAAQIRAEREAAACRTADDAMGDAPRTVVPEPADDSIRVRHRRDTGERHRGSELRLRPRWAWLRPTRRYDEFKDLLAAAEEQLSEQRAADLLGDRPAERLR